MASTYEWRRRVPGKSGFSVVKVRTDGRADVMESGLTRQKAKALVYRLNMGIVRYGAHNDAMPHVGLPGHVLGKVIDQQKREAAELFEQNRLAILAGMRDKERQEKKPFNMKGW